MDFHNTATPCRDLRASLDGVHPPPRKHNTRRIETQQYNDRRRKIGLLFLLSRSHSKTKFHSYNRYHLSRNANRFNMAIEEAETWTPVEWVINSTKVRPTATPQNLGSQELYQWNVITTTKWLWWRVLVYDSFKR